MNTLIFDTATNWEMIAIRAAGRYADCTQQVGQSHSKTFYTSLAACLEKAAIPVGEIGLIGVGVGPGSFTGVRLAVSAARMLAQVLAVPLVGLPSPLLFAASLAAVPGGVILVAFDAKKGRVFGALYEDRGSGEMPAQIVQPGDYPIDFILSHVSTGAPLLAFGDGAEKYREPITELFPKATLLQDFQHRPDVSIRLVEEAYQRDPAGCKDYLRVAPLYTRKSDAEVMKERGLGG